jgi:hypothetical protein
VPPGKGFSEAVLLDLRDRAAAQLIRTDYIPASLFEKTRALLKRYRAKQADGN